MRERNTSSSSLPGHDTLLHFACSAPQEQARDGHNDLAPVNVLAKPMVVQGGGGRGERTGNKDRKQANRRVIERSGLGENFGSKRLSYPVFPSRSRWELSFPVLS